MNQPKDFQQRSAERIVDLFANGQQRVLLADEVGLGKTIVARCVVEKMRENAKAAGLPFKVIYVCSNQGIIQQNAHKLGIDKDDVVPLSESRLSMQHKTLFKQADKSYLIPITPSTSLRQTDGYGNANERALIYSLIHADFRAEQLDRLKWYLDVYAKDVHTPQFSDASLAKVETDEAEYYAYIRRLLLANDNYTTTVSALSNELLNDCPDRRYINQLRTLFCEISMDMINPDLVIMDEFQRYRDLMRGERDTEENRLAQRLFNADNHPKILLISATPYKPMATMDEINQEGRNVQFEDFNNLMSFLMGEHYAEFQPLWAEYSKRLGTLSIDKVGLLIESKELVEQMLRKVMVRTERYVPNLAQYTVRKVMPCVDEVVEYNRFRALIDSAYLDSGKQRKPVLNIDYFKSSPYLLSFMQHYVEKTYIENVYRERKGPKKDKFKGLLIKEDDLTNHRRIKCSNARLQALYDIVFCKDGKGMENLLWIPPSLPYYEVNGVFAKCADASKILVFSKWGFVPRMIAAMLSHEATRLSHASTHSNTNSNALERYKTLLLSPFPKIADWFKKGNTCRKLGELRDAIKCRIRAELRPYERLLTSTSGQGYKNLLLLVQLLNGDITPESVPYLYVDEKTVGDIANLIIASPGMCMWRCFGSDYGDTYEECVGSGVFQFANTFVNMLGYEEGQAVIRKNTTTGTLYSRTLEYCVMGNLQATIDEYAFVMGYSRAMSVSEKNALWAVMQSAIINRTTIDIDTEESFCVSRANKLSVQRWFACDYAKISNNDKDEKRKQSIQAAFNSPFRPFVLASTSVGQEGLDFHLYCRKIVHWNLPSNPINLEQRSGRINRYEGLAIRRTIAHLFGGTLDWHRLFETAHTTWHTMYNEYNDMIPHWCVPTECLQQEDARIERIENIFPLYAMSQDIEEYDNLMKQLDLYRLTMGQPDQEFVINLLSKLNLSDENKDKLTFDLSPD